MTAIDTTLPSLTIVKSMEYRDAPEEWSNTYFFTAPLPADPTHWKALADAVILAEKAILLTTTTVVRAIGHQAGDSVAVWSFDYLADGSTTAGTFAPAGSAVAQGGDSAAWIRWSTDQLTSKGKPIYLRSYYHPAVAAGSTSTDRDDVVAAWITAAETYGTHWVTGFSDGTETHHRAGPHGVVGLVAQASSFVTTRTLERRGRRP